MSDKPLEKLQDNILPALIQALILCVIRFFTIPWRIWTGSTQRLARARLASRSQQDTTQNSEFPVLEWFRSAWDAIIFLTWPVGILIAVITLFGTWATWGLFTGISAAITVLVYSYFSVILSSLLKESLILILSIALNVEQLAKQKKETPQQD